MRITPLDIRKQEFRRTMRGLDADEVYAFLSTVGDEYEAVLNDNKALRDRVLELDEKVNEFRSMERTLRDTLITAERVTVEAKDNARREANLIVKEAQIEAEKALRDIKNEAMKLRQDVSQLRGQRESYLGRMKVIAESLLNFIESVDEDFRREDEAFSEQIPALGAAKPTPAASPTSSRANSPADNVDMFDHGGSKGDEGEDTTEEGLEGERPGTWEPESARAEAVKREEPDSSFHRATDSPGTATPEDQEPVNQPPLASLNAILDRMAEGHREMTGQMNDTKTDGTATVRPVTPPQFDPLSASPSGPIASDTSNEERPRALELGTAVEMASDERDSTAHPHQAEPRRLSKGKAVTSEIPIEQIRRDLERRMREKRNENK